MAMALLCLLAIANAPADSTAASRPMMPDIDKLWNYQDPGETEKRFREILPAAEKSGDASYLGQLLTQIARTQGLQGKFDEAHATLDQVQKMLTPELRVVQIRYLLERGRVFNSSGEPPKALPLFKQAVDVAAQTPGQIRLHIDAIHMVAIAEEKPEEQLKWNLVGLDLIEKNPTERGWSWALLNNTGETYLLLKDYQHALESFQKLAQFQRDQDKEADIFTLKDIAKCLRLLKRPAEATAVIEPVYRDLQQRGQEHGSITAEMAECLLAQGKVAEAKPLFARAYELLSTDRWTLTKEPELLERYRKLGM
jgi:tetratricopeptide (TPR) repeat protein